MCPCASFSLRPRALPLAALPDYFEPDRELTRLRLAPHAKQTSCMESALALTR